MTDIKRTLPDPGILLQEEIHAHEKALATLWAAVGEDFQALCHMCFKALSAGKKIVFFGNGGSAADAQHLAAELVVRYRHNRPALAGIALTTDTSALTAIGNDFGYDFIFSRQIEALGHPGDVAIAISTSGTSPNIIYAIKAARERGMHVAAFGGRDGGAMKGLATTLLIVPSDSTARIQEMHILLGHTLCQFLETAFTPHVG